MPIFNSQDRAQAWREAASAATPAAATPAPDADRAFRLHVLAAAAFQITASKLRLATDAYADALVETFDLLDATRLIDHDELRQTFEAIDDADGPATTRAFLAVLSRELMNAAVEPRADEEQLPHLLELSQLWRQAATADASTPSDDDAEVYLSVADVAAKYSVTRQAVYKWIHNGLLGARSRPGGSYQIPESALTRLNRPA
jgi:excisionase family DNA binding protein